jgi:polar amino acid transport system substrate-binding protein
VKLKDYEDLALEFKAVQTGAVAGAVNDIPVLLDFAKKNTDVEVAATFETGEQYGFGMKMGNQALATVVNEIIAQARQDGTYNQIYKKQGSTHATLPRPCKALATTDAAPCPD